MTAAQPAEPLYKNAPLLALCAIEYATGFFGAINGFSASYIAEDFGLAEAEIPQLFAWIAVGAIGTLFVARLSDRIGRRLIVLSATGMAIMLAVGSALAPNFASYIAIQIVAALFSGALLSTCTVIITEYFDVSLRTKAHSLAIFAMFGGGGLGLMAMMVLEHFDMSWRNLWYIAAALLCIALILSFKYVEETQQFITESQSDREPDWRELLKAQYTVLLVIAVFLDVVAVSAAHVYIYYFMITSLGIAQPVVTAIALISGVVGIMGTLLGSAIADRYGRNKSIIAATLGFFVATLAFYTSNGQADSITLWIWLFIGYATMLIFNTAREVSIKALSTELYPTHLRATMQGVMALTTATAVVIAHAGAALLTTFTNDLALAVIGLSFLCLPAAMMFLFIPETYGREIEVDYAGSSPWHK